ncbi:hypothetical protein PC116_g20437 [Phytophthora cactorum]|nr:hypothetical protein PC116_g20437 [Phytophthora cactorum]
MGELTSKDGAPVSRLMLQLQSKEVAAECNRTDKFAVSPT